jgi:HD-GYP domain-containing protein (c-di-GMP phosphodiesterase class II)
MKTRRRLFRRLKLRHVLLVALLLSGIIPLAISSALLIHQNQQILGGTQRDYLIHKAGSLSREVNSYLVTVRRQLTQLGESVLGPPGPAGALGAAEVPGRLREPWVGNALQSLLRGNPDLLVVRALDADGAGLTAGGTSAAALAALDAAFEEARRQRTPEAVYRFVSEPKGAPLTAVAVPIAAAGQGPRLVVEALLKFRPLEGVVQGEERRAVGFFLVDRAGKLLWSDGGSREMTRALLASDVVRSFVSRPLSLTSEYAFTSGGRRKEMLAQVSAVDESGWGLVVQKPLAAAFATVNRMIFNAVLSTVLLVAIAIFFAYLAAHWVSQPIQRLAETSHAIAAGNFGGRVEMQGLSFEFADLAEDFNRMGGHIESYVQQLRQAAQVNRDLFIGSLRAFAAAIDAKDPYTRGHSERVAAVSRTIARYLQLPEEVQHKVWIGALLHDVGKIGVEDRILRKEGVLTPEEYEQMKLHTVIGADIMAPIEQLKEQVPAIRWHHEAWNGRGYPDGLKGEQIPLFARIVAVADTFDAITTNRPYQQAYNLQFAVETITKLTGSRFDAKVVTAFLRAFEAGEVRAGAPRQTRAEVVEARAAGGQR